MATLHLINEIMPQVWAHKPQVRVQLVGKDPPAGLRARAEADSRIEVTGTVPLMPEYLRQASLAVAPVPYGAGIQNKVLEAMACGIAVVASPQAVSALAAVPGRDILVGETAEQQANAILRLLGDANLRGQVGRNGRTYVESHHDWEKIVVQLEGVYQHAIESYLR